MDRRCLDHTRYDAEPAPDAAGDDATGARRGATLHDVAQLAGVSAITVSRALRAPHQLAAGTLARVRAAIERTGYVPNLVAGGLRSARSRLVAAVVPTLVGPVFQETIDALAEALAARGYQLMLGQSGYGTAEFDSSEKPPEDALLDAVIGRRPDGIVLTGVQHSPALRRRLRASGIPVVEIWDSIDDPIDMLVGFSHEQIGAALARFLHERGRHRPALLSGDDARARQREAGFDAAAAELGWRPAPRLRVRSPTTHASGRRGFAELIAGHPETDALCCSSDMLALGALTEARVQGVVVPAECAVIGLGDHDFCASVEPALTTVRIDGTTIGRTAARLIIERAELGTARGAPVRVDVGFSIVERASS